MLERIKAKLRDDGLFAALALVEDHDDPSEVVKLYSSLIEDLYWNDKSLGAVVRVSLAGIQFSLLRAGKHSGSNAKSTRKLLLAAKALAYNLASFTWPGWAEPDIRIGESDLQAGLDGARLNLRLARELDRGDDNVAMALGMLGSQYLAAKRYEDARNVFAESLALYEKSATIEPVWLTKGYLGLVDAVRDPDDGRGSETVGRAIGELKRIGSHDAAFFARQLETALRVFVG